MQRGPNWDFLRCGGQARTVSPVDVMAVIGSQLTYCVEVAAELLADVEEQTVRSVHQAQRPGRESPSDGWAGGLQHVEGAGPAPPVRQAGVGRPSPAGTHGTPGGAAPPGRTRPPPPGPGSGRASLPSAPRGDRTSTSSRKGPRRPVSPQS